MPSSAGYSQFSSDFRDNWLSQPLAAVDSGPSPSQTWKNPHDPTGAITGVLLPARSSVSTLRLAVKLTTRKKTTPIALSDAMGVGREC